MEARYGFQGLRKTKLTESDDDDDDKIFDLSQRNLHFVIHFNDDHDEWYHNDGYDYANRVRDLSAPKLKKIDTSGISTFGDEQLIEDYEYTSTSCIDLQECIDIDRRTQLLQYNLWYCKKCKYFQGVKNRIESWNSPDLLIIHLNRVDNGLYVKKQNYIDMVIELEINQPLLVPSYNKDALYDLYAIKNYDHDVSSGNSGVEAKVRTRYILY